MYADYKISTEVSNEGIIEKCHIVVYDYPQYNSYVNHSAIYKSKSNKYTIGYNILRNK